MMNQKINKSKVILKQTYNNTSMHKLVLAQLKLNNNAFNGLRTHIVM